MSREGDGIGPAGVVVGVRWLGQVVGGRRSGGRPTGGGSGRCTQLAPGEARLPTGRSLDASVSQALTHTGSEARRPFRN
ncbi:hypothetical protein JCM4914_09830 [Streptomyces platensis subsp. malvinus]